MKICYVMAKWQSIHDQRFLDKFKEKNIEVCTTRVGIKTAILDYFRLKRILKKEKPDILHGGWIFGSGFVSALTKYHPFLLMPWGSDILINSYENLLYKKVAQYSINSADMITCDAEHVKNEIIRLSGYSKNKIIVSPWGIDLKRFNIYNTSDTLNLSRNRKRIILTRNFEEVYGIEYFLKALPKVIKEVPETRVLLCGKGRLESKFRNLIKKEKLENYMYFIGDVPNEKLPHYLNMSDLYVSPSLSDGTSLSLLEAMACELPCVVTDNPAICEWIENDKNGYIVPKRDSKILAERIINLLQDENKMEEFGRKNGQIAKKRADWNKNFDKLLGIYKELIE